MILFAVVWMALVTDQGKAAEHQKSILLIFGQHSLVPAVEDTLAGFERKLAEEYTRDWVLHVEYLDFARFPDDNHKRNTLEFLQKKYSGQNLDVIVAGGSTAYRFVAEHAASIAPKARIAFGAVSEHDARNLEFDPAVFGNITTYDPLRTIALARRLQPDARRIVVISGSGEFDQGWLRRAQDSLSGGDIGLPVEYVTGLTLEEFRELAAALDRRTIVLFMSVWQDSTGRIFQSGVPITVVSATSGAPVYTIFSSAFANGAVGGVVAPLEIVGADMATATIRAAQEAQVEPRVVLSQSYPVVDYVQMERYGLDPRLLPADAIIRNFAPSLWQRYRTEILLGITLALTLVALASALAIVERRRRMLSETLNIERLELARMSRVSQLGLLSSALAHELTQPLTAILHNAETARRLLQSDLAYKKEMRDIIGDILEDDRRATQIMDQMRKLVTKGHVELQPTDVVKAVRSVLRLTRGEFAVKQTRLEFVCDRETALVMGNELQLQQVVLNLLFNAASAVQELPPARRRVKIELATDTKGDITLAVRDWGPGVPETLRARIFEPFVSEKPEGVGIGLAICQWICEAHGGSIRLDSRVETGARIVVTLPSIDRVQAE